MEWRNTMSAAVTASVVGIAAGVNALTGGGITQALGFGGGGSAPSTSPGSAAAVANPMAPYQANLASMYAGYLSQGNQTDITKMPGYSQFQSGVLDPTMQASQARAASTGQLYSGGEQMALENIGQQGYSNFMSNYMSQLSAGATGNAYQGAQFGAAQQSAAQQGISQGLGSIATGLSGLSSVGGSGGMSGYINSNFGRDAIQADTGAAAESGQSFYGSNSSYDPSAGWSN